MDKLYVRQSVSKFCQYSQDAEKLFIWKLPLHLLPEYRDVIKTPLCFGWWYGHHYSQLSIYSYVPHVGDDINSCQYKKQQKSAVGFVSRCIQKCWSFCLVLSLTTRRIACLSGMPRLLVWVSKLHSQKCVPVLKLLYSVLLGRKMSSSEPCKLH